MQLIIAVTLAKITLSKNECTKKAYTASLNQKDHNSTQSQYTPTSNQLSKENCSNVTALKDAKLDGSTDWE